MAARKKKTTDIINKEKDKEAYSKAMQMLERYTKGVHDL